MSESAGEAEYEVHCSGAVAESLRRIQRKASRTGRGEAVLAAFAAIIERLSKEPWNFGEPLYRLSAMRMQVRSVAIRPLAIHYAVCEDRPVVFIKGARLLSRRKA